MRVFLEEASKVFQVTEAARHARGTPNGLADRLLHWFNAGFHGFKLIGAAARGQLAI